jgi:hypothetical protein
MTPDQPPDVAPVARAYRPVFTARVPELHLPPDERAHQAFELRNRCSQGRSLYLLYPGGKGAVCTQGQIPEQIGKRAGISITLAEVLENGMGEGEPVDVSRKPAVHHRDLGSFLKDLTDQFQFRERQPGVLAGELGNELHSI